jgi:hypothetical protein
VIVSIGGYYFWIVRINGRRHHNNVGTCHVPGLMAIIDFGPQALKSPGEIGLLYVRPANSMGEIEEQFSNSAHADATYADKMNMVRTFVHRVLAVCYLALPKIEFL